MTERLPKSNLKMAAQGSNFDFEGSYKTVLDLGGPFNEF